MKKLKIRKATKNDLKEISMLYEKSMEKHFQLVGEKPIKSKDYEKILNKNLNKSKMFVLYDNGIKGFIWYVKNRDEFNLEEIFVKNKGKGYGKILMNYMLNDAKENRIKRINGDIHFKNKIAINFFKKLGFTERSIEVALDLK